MASSTTRSKATNKKVATVIDSPVAAESKSSSSSGASKKNKKAAVTVQCSACLAQRAKREFTATQLKKRTGRLCNTCVSDKVAASTHDGSFVIACQTNDWSKAITLIRSGVDVNCFLPQQGSFYTALHLCCLQPSTISKRDGKTKSSAPPKPTSPGTKSIKSLLDDEQASSSLRVMLRCKPWGISPIGLAAWSSNDHLVRLLTSEVVTRWRRHQIRMAEEKKSQDKKLMQRIVLQRALGEELTPQRQRWPPDWYTNDGNDVRQLLETMVEQLGYDARSGYGFTIAKQMDLMIDMLVAGPKPSPTAIPGAVTAAAAAPVLPAAAVATGTIVVAAAPAARRYRMGNEDTEDDEYDEKKTSSSSSSAADGFRSRFGGHASLDDLITERIAFILDDERDRFEHILLNDTPAMQVLPPVLIPLIVLFCL